jgi:WhiB family redox-sensing transcriptional regulator
MSGIIQMLLREAADAGANSWMARGACRETDPELFFPIAREGSAVAEIVSAKSVCGRCDVRRRCLAYALRTMPDGIWGGTTGEERIAIRAAVRSAAPRASLSGLAQPGDIGLGKEAAEGEFLPQALASAEDRLVDGIGVCSQGGGDHLGRAAGQHHALECGALRAGEARVHHVPYRLGEGPRLSLVIRSRHGISEVLAQLGPGLQAGEARGPGGELALPSELAGLADDEQQRVGGRLTGEVVRFRTGDAGSRGVLPYLEPGHSLEERVQLPAGLLEAAAVGRQVVDPAPVL